MNPLLSIAIEGARAAGRIILKASERPDLIRPILKEEKGAGFVTETDLKAEEAILKIIQKNYPYHAIYAEESGMQGNSDTTWIIDPLDGTTNFAHNYPHYCVSIAIRIDEKIEHAVVYDPIRDELFTATAGHGVQLNGQRLRMKGRPLDQALIAATYPLLDRQDILNFAQRTALFSSITAGMRRTGSSALDLAYVAAGRVDICFTDHLKLWDFAASLLLIQEAGGLVTDWKGGDTYWQTGQILTAHPNLFRQVSDFFATFEVA